MLRSVASPANLFLVALVGIWAIATGFVPPFKLPTLEAVAADTIKLLTQPAYLKHALTTIGHVVGSVGLALIIGASLAFSAHYLPVTWKMIHGRLVPFLNSFSGIGWTFLAVIWFGLNTGTVIFAITCVLTPFAAINIREGLMYLDRETLEMSRSFTRHSGRVFCLITIPMLMPFFFGALRICFGVSWKIALTAELFGGNAGFGYLVNRARTEFETSLIFAMIIIIILVVHATDRLLFQPMQNKIQTTFVAQ